MENPDILEKILMYTGLAGLAIFSVFTLFKGIIQKNIFSSMTKEQSFATIKLIVRGSLFLAFVGVGAWVFTEIKQNETEKKATLISKVISGKVTTFDGQAIQNVKVALRKDESIFHETDVDGYFALEVTGTGEKNYDLVLTHPQYQNIRKNTPVDFAATERAVDVGELRLKPLTQVEIPDAKPTDSQQNASHSAQGGQAAKANENYTNITVYYDSEAHNCNLNINVELGGRIYTPQSNPAKLPDVPLGTQTYNLSGVATCYQGSCNIYGSLDIEITRNGIYYLVFDPSSCYTTLLDESTYNTLKQIFY